MRNPILSIRNSTILGVAAMATVLTGCTAEMAPEPGEAGELPHPPQANVRPEFDEVGVGALDETLTLIAQLRYADAAERLERLINTYEALGREDQAAEATFWLGYVRQKQGRYDEAAQQYRRVLDRWPDSIPARQARRHLNRLPPLETE